ncbi:MAG: TlpA family protein disulfide reductase [Acidobacteriia bacterium]|nr:TlpA family protein disulfide reductase [Terriglobia bacterium]
MRTPLLALLITLGTAFLGLPAEAAAPVPRPAKEFTVATPQGQQILISSLKGKVAVVQFLFTWCPHCQAFSKVLTQLNTEYGPRGFQALGVAFDDVDPKDPIPLKDKVVAYTKEHAGFPVGVSNRSTVLSYLGISELERIGVPQIMVIDRKGVIREQSTSQGGGPLGDPAHLKPLIESLLAEGAPAKGPAKTGTSTKPGEKKTAEKKTSE